MQAARVDTARNSTLGCTFFHSKSSTGATPLTLISIMATALKMNCAVETRPGSGSAFKQSLLMSSIEAEDIEYMIIAETDALVNLVSSGIVLSPNTHATWRATGACYWQIKSLSNSKSRRTCQLYYLLTYMIRLSGKSGKPGHRSI